MIVFYGLPKEQIEWIKSHHPKFKFKVHRGHLDSKNLPAKNTRILSVHTKCYLDNRIFDHLPDLELIVTRTTGTDHINLAHCKNKGINVVNSAGMNATSVAEFTVGLMLASSRHLIKAVESVGVGSFSDEKWYGTELSGKTLGVVGTGAIGSHVLEVGKALGMNLIAHDFRKNKTLARKLGFKYVGLKPLFRTADIISLHIPSTPLTIKMVNHSLLSTVKPGAGLVNTARGNIVDSAAVLRALEADKLRWYAADVLDHEVGFSKASATGLSQAEKKARVLNSKLIRHPRTIITPHMAHATEEARNRILDHTVEVIGKHLAGKAIHPVI